MKPSHNILDFGRKYTSAAENTLRTSLIDKHLDLIRRHNRDATKSWKMGVNELTDKTDAEVKKLMGYDRYTGFRARIAKQQQEDKKLHPLPQELSDKYLILSNGKTGKGYLPEIWDWRKFDVVSAVKDQGACGSCCAFASAAALKVLMLLKRYFSCRRTSLTHI